ncbi:MAG: PAS domain S-box protein, partial [Caldilinea sp.]|nr:PAS domain S-box protein [Caldilinea sp.]
MRKELSYPAYTKRKRVKGIARGTILALLLAGILLGVAPAGRAQNDRVLSLASSATHYPVDLYLDYFEDTAGTLTIEDVASPDFPGRFVPNADTVPNFGTTSSTIWVRLQVANMDAGSDDWRLAFSDALLSHIDFYAPAIDGDGFVHQRGGYMVPSVERPYSHPQYIFVLPLATGDTTTAYLRMQNDFALQFSLTLWPAAFFEQHNVTYFLLLGLAYGMLLFILIYHLFVAASVRTTEHFYFLVFLACAILSLTTMDGVAYLYLFPGWPNYYTRILAGSGVAIFGLLFVRSFLQLRLRVPWLDLIARLLLIGAIVLMFVLLALRTGFVFVYFATASAAFLALVGGFIVWRQGERTAGYFLLGWLGLLVLALMRSAAWLGIPLALQPLDFWSYISDILLFVFLSLALADQINGLRRRAAAAERTRQKSEARFRGLYEHAPLGIAIGDSAGLLLQSNAAYGAFVGYSGQELSGSPQGEFLVPEDRARSRLLFQQVLDGSRNFFQSEDRYLRKDGSVVWGLRTVAALRNPDGSIRNTFGIVSDVTERKRQEAELRRYSEQMEELVTARTAELERGQEQLVTLNRASQAINAVALEREHLFVAVRAAVAWLMPADFVAISLVDDETQEVEDVFLAGPHGRQPGRRTPLAGSFVAAMLARDLTLKVDDFATAPAASKGQWFGSEQDTRSGLAVILRRGQQGVGLLTVQSSEPNAYTAND